MHGSTTQGPRFEYNVTLLGCTPPTTNGTTKTLIVEWNCTSIPGSPKPTKNIFSKILKSSKMCWRTLCFKRYIIIYIYIISSDECSISQGGATWSCKKNASRGLVSPKRKLHCARIRGVFHQVRNSKLTVCILTNDVCKLQKNAACDLWIFKVWTIDDNWAKTRVESTLFEGYYDLFQLRSSPTWKIPMSFQRLIEMGTEWVF